MHTFQTCTNFVEITHWSPPERVTISSFDSPWASNLEINVATSANGLGRFSFALEKLAVVESLLPNKTGQNGPPLYINHQTHIKSTISSMKILHIIHKLLRGVIHGYQYWHKNHRCSRQLVNLLNGQCNRCWISTFDV